MYIWYICHICLWCLWMCMFVHQWLHQRKMLHQPWVMHWPVQVCHMWRPGSSVVPDIFAMCVIEYIMHIIYIMDIMIYHAIILHILCWVEYVNWSIIWWFWWFVYRVDQVMVINDSMWQTWQNWQTHQFRLNVLPEAGNSTCDQKLHLQSFWPNSTAEYFYDEIIQKQW